MKTKLIVSLFTLIVIVFLESCSKEAPSTPISPIYNTGNLFKMEDILDGIDQSLIALINKVRGSVGKRGPVSRIIWSRKNDYSLGLYIVGNHVNNISVWPSRNAEYFDVKVDKLGIFETCQLPQKNGSLSLGNTFSSDFPLMHFSISATATNTTIVPAEDFYLGIINNQRVEQAQLPQYPKFYQTQSPLEMYDPENRIKAYKTWNTPIDGEMEVVVGYLQDFLRYPNGAVARGKFLSNSEVVERINELKVARDSEGEIPYDSNGQLLGIAVRASDTEKVSWIIRIIKISYIRSKMVELYNSLSP